MDKRKLFGTDGIRGKANIYPMTGEIAMALGRAVTHYFQKMRTAKNMDKRPIIVIGKDTRRSCYMLEQAFTAGVCSQGGQVILTGPLPTPGVAFVTQSMRADAGVMISASHNNYADNGIKIFDGKGYKLPDEVELELEKMVLDPELIPTKVNEDLGSAKRLDEVVGRYLVNVKSTFSDQYDLDGMRLVLDCANGAAYKIAPLIFEELGAEVFTLGVEPNGININDDCGSLHPENCKADIDKYRADLGICLDGDADRVVIIDSEGRIVDGDALIGMLVKFLFDKKELVAGDTVVGTVMSNLGLEQFITSLGLKFHRAKVGDRYIMEYMKESGAIIGGEPSGHIILKKHATTGDGALAALKVIECMKFYNRPLHDLAKDIQLYPQIIKNVGVNKKLPLENIPAIQQAIREAEKILHGNGRILLRYSGTESLIRIMVEGKDQDSVDEVCNMLEEIVKKELL